MANKPIINVDVNDAQFKAFYELFQEYQVRVENMPKEWATVNASMKQSTATAGALTGGIKSATKAQEQFNSMARTSLATLTKMADKAESLGKSVFGIGKFLLKIGAIGGGIAGIGGILSAVSLRDLAHSAVQDQRGARGVGLSPGQYKAFGMDFGRFLDPSILSNVANAQNSYQGRVWLGMATGLNQAQVGSQGADQLSIQLAMRAHQWWEKTPASQRTEENLRATGFTQSGLSLEDMRRLGNTPISELMSARSQYAQDQRSLNVGNGTTQAWYEFDRQITLAGKTLETTLTNRLVALSPSLASFVKTLTQDAEILINEIFTPANLKSLESGIDELTSYLGSAQFKQDMRDFVGLFGAVVDVVRKAARFLGIDKTTSSPTQPGASAAPKLPYGLDPDEVQRETRGRVTGYGGISSVDKALGYARHFLTMPQHPTGPNASKTAADEAKNLLSALDAKNGLPPGTLAAMWMRESSEGKNLVGPLLKNGDQAIGDFQFTGAAWKDWGKGGDRFNFRDEADAAGRYMGSLKKKYGGDISKALAAYNWGPGNVDKAGAGWQSSLPPESRDYIKQITAALANQKVQVNVKVENSTASRVAVQANAAAAGH